jgi:Ca2+-binding EF-hand superfamily protein
MLVAALSIGFALTAQVFAADPKTDPVAARFKAMDTNGDGKVSKSEYLDYVKTRFEAMDTKQDGQVTVAEMDADRQMRLKAKKDMVPSVSSATRIQSMDIDTNGTLSASEYAAAAGKAFDTMDTKHDGQLTLSEMRIGYDDQAGSGNPPPGLD